MAQESIRLMAGQQNIPRALHTVNPVNGSNYMEAGPPPLLQSSSFLSLSAREAPLSPGKTNGEETVLHNGVSSGPTSAGSHVLPVASMTHGTALSHRGQAVAPAAGAEGRPRLPVRSLHDNVPSLIESSQNQRSGKKIDPLELAPPVAPPCSREKEEFMASLGLVKISVYQEIKARRQLRKRRKAAPYSIEAAEQEARRMREIRDSRAIAKAKINGRFAPLSNVPMGKDKAFLSKYNQPPFVPEREPHLALNVKETSVQTEEGTTPRKRKRQLLFICTDEHDTVCEVCNEPGQLLLCDACTKAYHFACLTMALPDISQGMWICPRCQEEAANTPPRAWPGTISLVRSFTQYEQDREAQRRELEEQLRIKQAARDHLSSTMSQLTESISEKLRALDGPRGFEYVYNPGVNPSLYHIVRYMQQSLVNVPDQAPGVAKGPASQTNDH